MFESSIVIFYPCELEIVYVSVKTLFAMRPHGLAGPSGFVDTNYPFKNFVVGSRLELKITGVQVSLI
jgi:hypothetical protein